MTYELRVSINCIRWNCSVDCVKFLYYISYSFLLTVLYKIKYSCSLQNLVFLVSNSWAKYFMNEWFNVKLLLAVLYLCNISRLTLFRMGGGRAKSPPTTNFFPVTSTNVRISDFYFQPFYHTSKKFQGHS